MLLLRIATSSRNASLRDFWHIGSAPAELYTFCSFVDIDRPLPRRGKRMTEGTTMVGLGWRVIAVPLSSAQCSDVALSNRSSSRVARVPENFTYIIIKQIITNIVSTE